MNGRRTLHAHHELRVGTREVAVVGVAGALILALTFASGVLVGRELGVGLEPAARAEEEGGPPSPSQQAEGRDRTRVGDRLTFYQALTAPTLDYPEMGPPAVEEHMVPRERPAKSARKTEPVRSLPAERPARTVIPAPARVRPPAGQLSEAAARPRWTVQVSSFRNPALAQRLRARLVAAGFAAYLVSASTDTGRVRHRVRVGEFQTRTEAERVARALRAKELPQAFVTARTD